METADNPKLEMGCSCEAFGLEEKTQKISVLSDQPNGIQYTTEKTDNFVIDMESLPHLGNREIPANSRITKSLSRKGSQRGMEKKSSSNAISKVNDRETVLANYSPRVGCTTPEKTTLLAVGTTDHTINTTTTTTTTTNPQVHHQITINTSNILNGAENRSFTRKNSFKRSHQLSWILDPKKVLLFFATLSSLGTILLILFTLSMRRVNGDEISFS